jgi:hypothetical protein
LTQEVAAVFWFADGHIVRVEYYFSGKQEALETVGRSE